MATSAQLNTEDRIRAFEQAVSRALRYNEQDEAASFCAFYEKFLREHPTFKTEAPAAEGRYETIYRRAQWAALPRVADEKEIVEMFARRVALLRDSPDYNLDERFRERLLALVPADRDELKAAVKAALLANETILTKPFTSSVTKRELPGTIGNWVKDYVSFVGAEAGDALKEARYYTEHQSFGALPKADQEFLKRIFRVVARASASSLSVKGYEGGGVVEVQGELVDFDQGKLGDIDPEFKRLVDALASPATEPGQRAARLRDRLADSPEEASQIAAIEKSVADRAGSDKAKLVGELVRVLSPAGGARVRALDLVGVLRAAARASALADVLKEQKLATLLRTFYERNDRSKDNEGFKVFPGAPEHLIAFVELALIEQAGISEQDAARHFIIIANLAKRSGDNRLVSAAFFDESANRFRFRAPLGKKNTPAQRAAPAS